MPTSRPTLVPSRSADLRRAHRRGQRGTAIPLVLFLGAAMALLLATAFEAHYALSRQNRREQARLQARCNTFPAVAVATPAPADLAPR